MGRAGAQMISFICDEPANKCGMSTNTNMHERLPGAGCASGLVLEEGGGCSAESLEIAVHYLLLVVLLFSTCFL